MGKRKITEGMTTQWPKDKSQKVRQHNGQKKNHRRYDNTMVKRQITEGQTTQWPKDKSQKIRQHNGQKTNDRSTHNDLHCTTQTTQ
jgi:hypothetical protein